MKKLLVCLFFLLNLYGCASYQNYYKLDEDYLKRRQMETRFFEVKDEEKMLISASQVLQDMEFIIDESETKLGLITASKNKEVGNSAGKVAVIFLAALGGSQPIYDVEQKIYVTIVSTKHSNGYNLRADFSRIIWNNMGEARVEKINDEETYQGFFEKLNQSVFLTENDL